VKVYQAINAVQLALCAEGISKGRKNNQQGYNFRGIDDIYNVVSPLLGKHGLCILPRVLTRECIERQTKSGGALFYVTCEVEFDFVCAEDGSKHVVKTYGEAMDSADKATNKAMSAAYKYAVMQSFAIPTEGDNDADAHTPDVAPRAASPRKPANEGQPDMSPKARAQRIAAGVADGDASGAAAAMSEWDEPLLNSVWALLEPATQDRLTAAWPKAA
jgi:hypothetical protein